MASIGSLPFTAETAMETSFLHSGNHWNQRFMYMASRGRSSLGLRPNVSVHGFPKNINGQVTMGLSSNCDKMLNGCNSRRQCRSKSVRANATKDEDGDNKPENRLEATLEKTKKVLAMQDQLLQEIAERRKLVSSIKNSFLNRADDVVSYNETDNSFQNLGLASDGEDKQFGSSTAVNEPDGVGGNFDGSNKGPGQSLPLEKLSSDVDFPIVEKTDISSFQSDVLSSFQADTKSVQSDVSWPFQTDNDSIQSDASTSVLFESSEIHGPEVKKENSTETSFEDETVEAVRTPDEEEIKPPPLAGANVMNVILVAAECAPWSKTGGLGDVAGALPKALARRGHRVMVVAPRYGDYAELHDTGVRKRYNVTGQDIEVTYHQTYIDGVDFVFIDSHMFHHIENNIYGGDRVEITRRMILFCKAAVEVPWHVPCGGVCYGDGNLVFIANDWHTALLPVYLKAYYRDNGLMTYTRSVLVIHNIAHQGRGPVDDFSYMDLPGHYFDHFKLYDPVGGEHCNIFAAGLKAADRIVTVSHGYSWELKTVEGGWGLHGIINDNHWKLSGIVNGIDVKEWNPQLDVHLKSDGYTNYSLETLKPGKAKCKKALQKELGLPVRKDIPLIGFIGRLDNQKGVDLIAEAIPWMVGEDVQLVMLGTGRKDLEDMLKHFENQYRDRIRGWVGFSVKMSHRITAAVDILLMPSRFEPCGLNQLYAMSYGTIPVVHAVGGLRDTVQPFDPYKDTGVGWTFERAEKDKLIHALGNCLYTYREYKSSWEDIQKRGMTQDLSWDNAAQNYEEVLIAAKFHW